jgi:LytS/YehU family sensor histidine kinase
MIYLVPLTLQILTENAVKHNIVSATKPLEITITREGDQLKVCNNLQVRLTAEKSTHFGLQSLSRRYLSITGKEIQVEQTEKYFCVTIPLIKV